MICHWCDPSSNRLAGPRCRACQQIYELHIKAETDGRYERRAMLWIRHNAASLRNPDRLRLIERAAEEPTINDVTIVSRLPVNGGRRYGGAE